MMLVRCTPAEQTSQERGAGWQPCPASLSQGSSCFSVSTTTAAVSEGGGGGLVQPVLGRGPAALTKAMTQSRGRRPLSLRNLLCVPSRLWYLSNGDEETVSGLLVN